LITAPEGVADGLAHLHGRERRAAESLVRGDHRLSAVERLDVYADMYFYRIRDCVKEDFPAVARVVGEACFHNLITDYLLAHPPTHFSLRYAGQHLTAFAARHPLAERWPYLSALAALEWAILEAFDAADAEPITAAALAGVPEGRWPDLRFDVTPSLQLLSLHWPVHTLWQRVQQQGALGELEPEPTFVRVWRRDLRVFHHAIDAAEHAALGAVRRGEPLAAVCEYLATSGSETANAERAAALLQEWIADGLLSGLRVDA
jgi:hypothetical protein